MTDQFRAMCAELLADYDNCHYRSELADRARFGRPTPQPPADGEVAELVEWLQSMRDLAGEHNPDEQRRYTRAAELLEHPTPQPVAVSERLPGPDDCDEQGRCWVFDDQLGLPSWTLIKVQGESLDSDMHWLPANALPTPEATNE